MRTGSVSAPPGSTPSSLCARSSSVTVRVHVLCRCEVSVKQKHAASLCGTSEKSYNVAPSWLCSTNTLSIVLWLHLRAAPPPTSPRGAHTPPFCPNTEMSAVWIGVLLAAAAAALARAKCAALPATRSQPSSRRPPSRAQRNRRRSRCAQAAIAAFKSTMLSVAIRSKSTVCICA